MTSLPQECTYDVVKLCELTRVAPRFAPALHHPRMYFQKLLGTPDVNGKVPVCAPKWSPTVCEKFRAAAPIDGAALKSFVMCLRSIDRCADKLLPTAD